MRKQSIVVHATMILSLVVALSTVALAADPHVGTWKLNIAKSKVNSGPPDKSQIVTITAQDNGIKLVADTVDADGKATHGEFAAKLDGKDYPATGGDFDTIALKKIDANTWSEVAKKSGKEIWSGTSAISKDGKTMTHTTKGKDAKGKDVTDIHVSDKQ